jgi:hypothetical protein
MQPAVVEKNENQGRCTWERKGAGDSKSPSPMRAAECFWPLPVIQDVESVRKHETGLERGQWLLRKQRFTVLVHSIEATEIVPARGKKEVKKREKDPVRAGRLVLHGHVPL